MKECKTIDLIAMVYKSIEYTEHILEELRSTIAPSNWKINIRVIANDPHPTLIDYIEEEFPYNSPFVFYNDPKPDDYYLNRVYRCWNYAGFTSKADSICFINSDMMFSPNWLINLLKHHDGTKIPCSRLVESGKLLSGQYAVSKDFGRHPTQLNREEWYKYAEEIHKDMAPYGGLFMPCILETQRFKESGGYPEGNIYRDGPGTLNGPVIQSGDDWYFRKLEKEYKMKHVTVFDSLVYHIQEGELND